MGDFLSDVFVLEFDFFHITIWVVLLGLTVVILFLAYWIIHDMYWYFYTRSKKHLSSAIDVTISQLVTNPSNFENQYIRVCGRVCNLIRNDTYISRSVILTPMIISGGSTLFLPNTLVSSENREYWIFADNNKSIVVFNEDFEIKSGEELILYGYWQKSEEDDKSYILDIELAQGLIENN